MSSNEESSEVYEVTYLVFRSKTGVLHVSKKQDDDIIHTFGSWDGNKVKGAGRSLDRSKLTPAGYIHRIEDTWTYHPEDEG